MTDYYHVMGVTSQAGAQEIKAAYRKLAKQYHPDAMQGHPERKELMYEIQAAYEVLGDEQKRSDYDKSRQKQLGREQAKQPAKQPGNPDPAINPDMSRFGWLFGFQPANGKTGYEENGVETDKSTVPLESLDTQRIFDAYFGRNPIKKGGGKQ